MVLFSTQKRYKLNQFEVFLLRVKLDMPIQVNFVLSLEVGKDDSVTSSLKLLNSEDVIALQTLPSGGLTQVPHALFIETLRREAYTMAISLLSNGSSLEDLETKELDQLVRTHLLKMMDVFSKDICSSTISQIRSM